MPNYIWPYKHCQEKNTVYYSKNTVYSKDKGLGLEKYLTSPKKATIKDTFVL